MERWTDRRTVGLRDGRTDIAFINGVIFYSYRRDVYQQVNSV